MSRRSRQVAHRQSNGVAAILAAPVIERIANHLGLPAPAPASRPTLTASSLIKASHIPFERPSARGRRTGCVWAFQGRSKSRLVARADP